VVPTELPDDLDLLKQVVCDQDAEITRLRQQLAVHQRARFGPSRERLRDDQAQLFPEDIERVAPPTPTAPATPVTSSNRNGRRRLPADLPRTRVEYPVPAAQQICTGCDQALTQIGEDCTEELEYTPAQCHVIAHVRPKFACRRCQDHVVQQPLPPRLIERGRPGPGLLAHLLVSKFGDHLPLARQAKIFARHGVDLAASTLGDWVAATTTALAPIVQAMQADVLAGDCIQTDDIPVPVLDPGRGRTKTGRLWPYLGGTAHRAIVFDYTPTRAQTGPDRFLEHWRGGWLQTDGYGGYARQRARDDVIAVGCWAHVRRKFYDAQAFDRVPATAALQFIGRLYDVERAAAHASDAPAARQARRLADATPILLEFEAWLTVTAPTVLPKSALGVAITYARNQWPTLTRYVEEGRLAIDNNRTERSLRRVAVGRKNWLFAGSDAGGARAAIAYSLLATCDVHGVEPLGYLRDVLTRLPTHPADEMAALTPYGWTAAQAAAPVDP